ncbi:hypothetical protein EAF00_006797 [Botryotinia globosa]|nr:hypothetical protein EAF00_006797 [Botryotinia globosa]
MTLGTNITLHENVLFPLFSTFPSEIRCQIWKHALIGPYIHIHDPRPQWNSDVISWTLGTIAFLPYQMCEEIYVVLNDVTFTLDHGVTFVELVDGHDEPLSSRKFTSQGYEKLNSFEDGNWALPLRSFSKTYRTNQIVLDYQESINEHRWFRYPPIIRYVIAKADGTPSLFTCIKNQKPTVVGHKSLAPLNMVSLPDHLKKLVSNSDDDSWFPVENGTEDYTSDNAEEDVYEDDLEYDSDAGDEDVEDDEDDEGNDKEEAEAENENLSSSTSFQDYAAFTNNGDGMGHDQMPLPDENDADL